MSQMCPYVSLPMSLYVSVYAVALRNIAKVISVEGELHLLSRQGVALLVIGVYVCACVRACVCACVCKHKYTLSLCLCVHVCACLCVNINTHSLSLS
jgi:hypothetical protein